MLHSAGGGVLSQNLGYSFNNTRKPDYALHRGMIIKIRYTDNSENLTKEGPSPRPLYDLVTLGGSEEGRIVTNCRLKSELGSNTDYAERILRATTKSLIDTPLAQHDGTVVYFQFLNGMRDFPVIVGCDQGLATGNNLGATEADGIRSIRKFNGVEEVIDKDGVLTIRTAAGIAIRITDTTVFLGDVNAVDFVANATKVNANFTRLKAELTALIAAIGTALSTNTAGNEAASALAFTNAMTAALIPGTPTPVDFTKVKAI